MMWVVLQSNPPLTLHRPGQRPATVTGKAIPALLSAGTLRRRALADNNEITNQVVEIANPAGALTAILSNSLNRSATVWSDASGSAEALLAGTVARVRIGDSAALSIVA